MPFRFCGLRVVTQGIHLHGFDASVEELEPLGHSHRKDVCPSSLEVLLVVNPTVFQLFLVFLWEKSDKENDFGVVRQTMPTHFLIAF